MNLIPLFSCIVAFIFSALLIRQYFERKKIYQLLWTFAFLFFGISTLMEFLMNPELLGINESLFDIFYILASSLVGLLGAGELYLILKGKIAHVFLLFIIISSIALTIAIIITPFPNVTYISTDLGDKLREISKAYDALAIIPLRLWGILLPSIGGMVLIIGSAFSFIKDRTRFYILFIIMGAIMAMLGAVPFGYFGNELATIILIFIGFILSNRKSDEVMVSK